MMNGIPNLFNFMGRPPMMNSVPNFNNTNPNQNLLNNFQQFAANFQQSYPNMDPRSKVQELLNSGQMTQDQYNQLRMQVNQLTGMNL